MELAQRICDVVDKGDLSKLGEILHRDDGNDRSPELLTTYHETLGLLGRQKPNLSVTSECEADGGESTNIKPSSLLKALLHVNSDTTWAALNSTINGLEVLSANERNLCIEAIQAFIVNLQSLAKEKDKLPDVAKIISRLYDLSQEILAPLRLDGGSKRHAPSHRMGDPKALDLIPTVLEALDDLHVINSSEADGNDLTCKVTANDESSDDEFCMLGTNLDVEESSLSSQDEEKGNCTRAHGMKRASDRLFTSLFVSVNNKHQMRARRIIRADAVLTLLQMAVDDVGMERLSTDVPLFNQNRVAFTGLECLQFALDSVLHASLSYYLDIEDKYMEHDGRDVIPIEDYPALIKCIFRMLDFDMASSSHQFEGILLRTIHVAAFATNRELASAETESFREDNTMNWPKVTFDSIVSCIGECSTSTINRVLVACARVSHGDNPRVPVWIAAKVVLLISSARVSSVAESSSFEPFRPHLLQKMTCERMHKMAAEQNPDICLDDIGSNEEASKALEVLLNMAARTQGRTRLSSTGEEREEARESLTESYYSVSAGFLRRHPSCGRAGNDFGLQTLNSYTGFVKSSLIFGQDQQVEPTISAAAFSEEFIDRWLELAYRLLDAESTSYKRDGEKNEQQRHDGESLALVAVVYIFFHIPKSQSGIMDRIRDRIVKSVGGCSYFDLTAILAWSLVGQPGQTNSSSGKTIEETRYCTEVLSPLCDLLSTPAVSDDDIWWKSERGMNYHSLYLLSRALIPLPLGRKVVLATARKHFYTSKMRSTESTFFALSTLLALIEERNRAVSNELDDFGKEALSQLTDIVVQPQSNPCLTPAVTDWLLGELTEKVVFSKIVKHASLRLMRACSVALLQLCRSERTVNCLGRPFFLSLAIEEVFTPESCEVGTRINVTQVMRLMVALYGDIYDHHCSSSSDRTGMLPPSTLLKPHILRIALAQHSSLHSVLTKSDQVVKSGLATLEMDANDVGLSVDATVLVLVFESLVRLTMDDQLPTGGQLSGDPEGKLIECLRRAEYSFYGNDFQPKWTRTKIERSHSKPSRQVWLKSEQLYELKQSFGFMTVEMLFHIWSKNNVVHEPLALIGALAVQEKMRDLEMIRCGATREHRRIANELSCGSICGFFQLTAQHVPPLLQAKGSRKELLPELDLLVKSVLEQCYAISSDQLQPRSPLEDFELYSAVHALYFAIASEEPAHLMTAFVTEHYRANGVWEDDERADDTISTSNFTFKSLPTSNDLDDHVRFVREITLQAFSRALKSIASSSGKLAAHECEILLNSLLETLPQLCQDFDCCFQGYSGGITKSLMKEFLYVIESCLDAIASLLHTLPPSNLRTDKFKLSSIGQSSTLLWTLLKEEAVTTSFLKEFISLSVDKIPSLLRRAELITGEAISSNSPAKTLCDLLERCRDSVATGICSGGQSVKGTSEPRSPNSNARNEADPTVHASLTQNLSSPKALACALECCFAAMDAIWDLASGRILEPERSIHIGSCTGTSSNIRRIDEVAQLFTTLYRYFDGADSHGSQEPTVIAALLSFKGKVFLCGTLEKMTNVLASSISVIMSKLSTPTRYFSEDSSFVLDESLRESLICFVGWLRSIEQKTAKFDNLSGPNQWCAIEQERASESKRDSKKLIDRLADNIVRSHECMEDDTRELTLAIDAMLNNGSSSDEISSLLSQFLPIVAGSCPAQLFSDLLHRCIQCVDDSMSKVRDKCPSNIEDSAEDESESNDEFDGLTLPRKRHKRQFDVRRKSRTTFRTRHNSTIDEWLTLDNSKSNGRKHSSDSYMDLEDFIVDG